MGEPTKVFDTGAVRSSDAEAVRYDLISPIALEALARTCAEGAAKYGDFNWEKGMPAHDLLNHALRHIYRFLTGDRTEEHLAHAMWNVGGAIHSLAIWPDLNNGKLRSAGCGVPIHNELRSVNGKREEVVRMAMGCGVQAKPEFREYISDVKPGVDPRNHFRRDHS